MSGIKDQAEIEAMRRRLYERGTDIRPAPRHDLSPKEVTAPTTWPVPPAPPAPLVAPDAPPADPRTRHLSEPSASATSEPAPVAVVPKTKRRFSYRAIILLTGLGFFIMTVLLSSLYMMFGNNQISNHNIAVTLSGPLTIGGGEVLPLQATITNQNRVPIESAILIVRFPSGTKAGDGSGRDILEERIQLERINAGESLNVPVRAIPFGQENQERSITAELEYRLVDSNGTFYKRAEPFNFSIHSSPLNVRVTHLEKVASGQEIDITLEVQSNATAPIQNLIVSANYPINFDYSSANPAPAFRENTWLIGEIVPEQTVPIKIKGVVLGNQNEEFQIQFQVGNPRQDNQFIVGAILATANADFIIERPFINITSTINGQTGSVITTDAGGNTTVAITVENTLNETLFDMALEVAVSGNVLARDRVIVQSGFYDSIKDVIRFDVSGDRNLAEVPPGGRRTFTFSITPNQVRNTPTFEITANALARRVSEDRVIEQLIGSVKSEVRYTSNVATFGEVRHVSGPVPPVADETTVYEVTFSATAGGNDVTGAVVTSSLPQYVDWTTAGAGVGSLIFNPVSKEITWNIGDIESQNRVTTMFRIAFTPSQAQIGRTPALVGAARLRATDRFTGVVVRAEDAPKSTELSSELGFGPDSGKVQPAVISSSGDNEE